MISLVSYRAAGATQSTLSSLAISTSLVSLRLGTCRATSLAAGPSFLGASPTVSTFSTLLVRRNSPQLLHVRSGINTNVTNCSMLLHPTLQVQSKRTITSELLAKQEEDKKKKKEEDKAKARGALWSLFKLFLFTSPLTVVLLSLTKGANELSHWLHLEAEVLPHSASLLPDVRANQSEITSCNVTYVYEVGDRVIKKTQLRSPFWCSLTQLLGKRQTYQVGQKVRIRSMPEDPTFSKLDPLPFSWWVLSRSPYDPIGDFVDGKPVPPRGYELDKQRAKARSAKPPPFKGRTRPPSEGESTDSK